MLLMCSLLFLFVPSVPRVPYVPSAFSIIPSVYMCRVCSRLCPVFPVWSPLFPVFPIESRVANVFPLVPCFSYFSPSVSRLFLVFWVGITCGRPPAAGPTLSTQKQSVLLTRYPVPSVFPIVSCVPSGSHFPCFLSVFPVCSLLFTRFPVSIILSMFLVCPLCDPHCSLCTFPVCMYPVCSLCSQCVPSKAFLKGKLYSQCVTISNTGFNREHWEQWRPHREHRTQSGTHSTHIYQGSRQDFKGRVSMWGTLLSRGVWGHAPQKLFEIWLSQIASGEF